PPPGKAGLTFSKKSGDPSKSRVQWSWSKGPATLAQFGNPTATTAYRLCVYDSGNNVVVNLNVPGGGTCLRLPCWQSNTTGLKYGKPSGLPNGVTKMSVSARSDGTGKIKVKAQGFNLSMPSLPLAQSPNPVRVLLINSQTNACWSATYSAPPKSRM